MSQRELILVRHGQANASGENYDELTSVGCEQATQIGRWLATSGYAFDRLVHGGLMRQEQTLDLIGGELGKVAPLPKIAIHPAFAEFDLKVFAVLAAEMRHGRPDFADVLKEWNKARHDNSPGKGEVFKKMMGLVLTEWVKRGTAFTAAESFPAFQARVLSAMEFHSDQPGAKILAVTSGGPISLLVGHVLGLELTQTLGLMRRIYNTSLHRLIHTGSKWELASFNEMPHLGQAERTLV